MKNFFKDQSLAPLFVLLGFLSTATVLQTSCGDNSVPGPPQAPGTAATGTVQTHTGPLGEYLTDSLGRSLYLFTADTEGQSTCNGSCTEAWPPLTVTTGTPSTAGGDAQLAALGSIQRMDNTTQVTYEGHPLYHFSGDTAAGDTNGQGLNQFGALWYLVKPDGTALTGTPPSPSPSPSVSASPSPSPSPSLIPLVQTTTGALGEYLSDTQGRSLYAFLGDTNGQSNCAGACAQAWPPLTLAAGEPGASGGAQQSLLSTIQRADGTVQATYKGRPLYHYSGDAAASDTNGEGITAFGALWYLVKPDGSSLIGSG